MNDKIVHRGPDAEGIYLYENVGLGHRRLSIIDLSDNASQPMSKKEVTITYNGEIYNYLELKNELTKLGYKFNSSSDTEVILNSYLEWGVDCFGKFNGMWAMALLDVEENKLLICRDNFGIKPLFYGFNSDYFYAGSEIKQFLDIHGKRKLNLIQCINYLNSGLLNYNEHSFFEGIFELRAGYYLELNIQNRSIKKIKWYDPQYFFSKDGYNKSKNKIRNLFENSIRIRLRSDVEIGACLSGGIDSSSIISIISEIKDFNVKELTTFTSFYDDKKSNELDFSNIVVKEFHLKNIKIKPDLLKVVENNLIDKIVEHHEQPFSSMSNYSQLEVYKLTKSNKIKVLLDGQGADEFFQGYNIFRVEFLRRKIKSFKFLQIRKFVKSYAVNNGISITKSLKVLILDPFILIPIIQMFQRKKTIKLFSRNMNNLIENRNKYIDSKSLVKDQMFRSNLPALLHSADRNSMMFSIETRLPFLDFTLFEYVTNISVDYLFKDGFSKSILRDSIESLPNKIKNRVDKMGFEAPTKQFVLNNSNYIRHEIIDLINKCTFLNKEIITEFDLFLSGNHDYDEVFFRLFTLNRFLAVFSIDIEASFRD